MGILAVRPEYQRKGLGSMLLTPVLELADKDKAKVFVQASVKGLGLYLKHGWIEVDEILLDFSPYGGEKQMKTALLIREPRSIQRT
jgi:GNAT superfamily N-acetyltransferase